MKNPQWFYKTPTSIVHPASVLKDAARVIECDARLLRKAGSHAEANYARQNARCLRLVADGKTWAEAFELDV